MRRPVSLFPMLGGLATLLAAAALLVLLAAAARAEGEGSALDRLTAEERQHLERRVPGWAELPEARKERIAQNVLRLRDLTPEEREHFVERVKELERRREHGHPRGPTDGPRGRALLVRALGHVLFEDLSEAAREALGAQIGGQGRGLVEMAFFRRVLEQTVEARARQGFGDLELPEAAGADRARRFERLKAKAAEGDAGARRMLGMLALGREHERFLEALKGVTPGDGPRLADVGRRFKDRYGEAYGASLAELESVLAAGGQGLEAYVRPEDGPRGPGGEAQRALRLLRALEEARPWLARERALTELGQRLEWALVRHLAKAFDLEPPGEDLPADQRRAWMRRLLERLGRDGAPGRGPGPGGRRGQPPGGRPGR